MAEEKKGFVLYADLIYTLDKLPDELAGKLFKTILEFVNDRNPEPDDLLLSVTFEPIKQQLKRDLKKWEVKKTKNSENGKLGNLKRYNFDLYEKVINEEITLDEALYISSNRKDSPPDRPPIDGDSTRSQGVAKLAVKDNVNVTVKDKEKGKINDNNIPKPTSYVNSDKKKEEKEDLTFYSEQVHECYYSVLDYFPETSIPKSDSIKNKWLDTIDKLNRIDNIDFDTIIHVCKKAREDDFWKKNFITINKLRSNDKEGNKYIYRFIEAFKSKSVNKHGYDPKKIRAMFPEL